jgi:hypothetical protein
VGGALYNKNVGVTEETSTGIQEELWGYFYMPTPAPGDGLLLSIDFR